MPFHHGAATSGADYRYPPDRDVDVARGAVVEREALVLWIEEGTSDAGRPKIVVRLGIDPEACKLDLHAAAGTITLTQLLSALGEPHDAEVDGEALCARHGGRTRLRVWITRQAKGDYAGRLQVRRVACLRAAAEAAAGTELDALMGGAAREEGANDAPF